MFLGTRVSDSCWRFHWTQGHKLWAAPVIAMLILSGCRAMETHDIDGNRYPDDQGPYYATSKRADIARRGFATAWHSGSLTGICEDLGAGQSSGVADTLVLETQTLFATDDARLGSVGQGLLDEVLERVSQYEVVTSVSIDAHTDRRGSSEYNLALSQDRAESVRQYLQAGLEMEIPLRVGSWGESSAGRFGETSESLQLDRRVRLRVEARGPRDDSSSVALCAPETKAVGDTGPVLGQALPEPALAAAFPDVPVLSAGDRVRLRVIEDPDLDGIYEVDGGGRIDVPFVGAVDASGQDVVDVEVMVGERLVETGYLHRRFSKVDVAILQYAQADVFVSGAVFDPGRKTINALKVELKQFKQTQVSGDSARDRMLSDALQVSGGIRPDADLTRIEVTRSGKTIYADLSGLLSGEPAEDLSLIQGDVVKVPSSGVFQEELVRVSQITPPGVRVYISNLSTPAQSNAQSAVGRDSTSLPYGTRMLQALLSANCIGGTQYTNGARRAVLVSVNPINGRTEVIERSVQQLISDPDRDSINPFLMPNDGIACYDSEVTNIRDIARAFTDVLTPLSLLRVLLK